MTASAETHSFATKTASAVFYGISSILIIFINKIVLTTYGFPSFLLLGIGQMVATIVILFLARLFGIVTFPRFSRDIPAKLFPLPLIYVVNLVTGLGGTQRLNLPMFTVLRRFSIFMIMCLEYLILGVRPSNAVKISVGLMILGAFIAAIYDLTFDTYGYTLILINDFCTASNGVYMKKKLESKELGKYGLMFYNSLFMLGPALILAYGLGEFDQLLLFRNWTSPAFIAAFLTSCVCGFVLNYSVVLCTHVNSALTTACVGPIKNLFVTYGGMFFGGDYIFSWNNFLGINISVLGSILYTYVTFRTAGKSTQTAKPKKLRVSPHTSDGDAAAPPDAVPLLLGTESHKKITANI